MDKIGQNVGANAEDYATSTTTTDSVNAEAKNQSGHDHSSHRNDDLASSSENDRLIDDKSDDDRIKFTDWGFSIEKLFEVAYRFYKKNESKAFHPSFDIRNKLNALILQAKFGNIDQSKSFDVGALDLVGRSRRHEWSLLSGMSKKEAMIKFIYSLDEICPIFRAHAEAVKIYSESQAEARGLNLINSLGGDNSQTQRTFSEQMEMNSRDNDIHQDDDQLKSIHNNLCRQTYSQFKQYAQSQHPNDVTKQKEMISNLQEQYFQQYITQMSAELANKLNNYSSLNDSDNVTKQSVDKSSKDNNNELVRDITTKIANTNIDNSNPLHVTDGLVDISESELDSSTIRNPQQQQQQIPVNQQSYVESTDEAIINSANLSDTNSKDKVNSVDEIPSKEINIDTDDNKTNHPNVIPKKSEDEIPAIERKIDGTIDIKDAGLGFIKPETRSSLNQELTFGATSQPPAPVQPATRTFIPATTNLYNHHGAPSREIGVPSVQSQQQQYQPPNYNHIRAYQNQQQDQFLSQDLNKEHQRSQQSHVAINPIVSHNGVISNDTSPCLQGQPIVPQIANNVDLEAAHNPPASSSNANDCGAGQACCEMSNAAPQTSQVALWGYEDENEDHQVCGTHDCSSGDECTDDDIDDDGISSSRARSPLREGSISYEPLEAPLTWTKKGRTQFKDSLVNDKQGGTYVVTQGVLYTIQVPTYPDGRYIYWEFATDDYDIGFGVDFVYDFNLNFETSMQGIKTFEKFDDDDDDEEVEEDGDGQVGADDDFTYGDHDAAEGLLDRCRRYGNMNGAGMPNSQAQLLRNDRQDDQARTASHPANQQQQQATVTTTSPSQVAVQQQQQILGSSSQVPSEFNSNLDSMRAQDAAPGQQQGIACNLMMINANHQHQVSNHREAVIDLANNVDRDQPNGSFDFTSQTADGSSSLYLNQLQQQPDRSSRVEQNDLAIEANSTIFSNNQESQQQPLERPQTNDAAAAPATPIADAQEVTIAPSTSSPLVNGPLDDSSNKQHRGLVSQSRVAKPTTSCNKKVVSDDPGASSAAPMSQKEAEKLERTLNTLMILPTYRRDSHEEIQCGRHRYPGPGYYLLKFDNTYSVLRSKSLYFRICYFM